MKKSVFFMGTALAILSLSLLGCGSSEEQTEETFEEIISTEDADLTEEPTELQGDVEESEGIEDMPEDAGDVEDEGGEEA